MHEKSNQYASIHRNHAGSWIIEAMEKAGVDLAALSDLMPGEFDQLIHVPDTLQPDDLFRLLKKSEELSGDNNIGLHLSSSLELTRVGTYGYLLLNAPTIQEFLQLSARYYPLIYRGARLEFSVSGQKARLSFRIIEPFRLDPRHLNEWTLGFYIQFIRSKLYPDWEPDRVFFSHKKPSKLEDQFGVFGRNIKYAKKVTGFEFPASLLDHAITESNPVLLRIISHHADDLIQEIGKKQPFKAQVRLLIMEGLDRGQAKAEIIAGRLNMSLSGFKRRMQEEQLSFRQLRDEIVRDLSQRALIETNLPVSDIAYKMGYSELSAFDRAFSRMCGTTPLAYRKRHTINISTMPRQELLPRL